MKSLHQSDIKCLCSVFFFQLKLPPEAEPANAVSLSMTKVRLGLSMYVCG